MQITADNLSNGGIHLVSRMKNEFAWKNTVIERKSTVSLFYDKRSERGYYC